MNWPVMCLTMLVLIVPCAAEELRAGPWTVRYDGNGVQGVSYEEVPVLGGLGVSLFTTDYRGSQFSLQGSRVSSSQVEGGRALLFERESEAGRAVARLVIAGNVLRWSVDLELSAAGPFEMNVPVPRETAELPLGDLSLSIGPVARHVAAGRRMDQMIPRDPVRIEGTRRDLVLRPDPDSATWLLQDRRDDATPVVRIVGCLRSTGEAVLKATPAIEVEVVPLAPEEAHSRELVFSQRQTTLAEAPVRNPGFEEDDALAGWSHGPNASRDATAPASGDYCARLEVASAAETNVYITQQVPVKPGRHYRLTGKVRCQDVTAAEGMRMASVGAVLIHEWADREGKWLQAGDYSESLWGTVPGWRSVACTELVAPEHAGYAVIFLGLRATGTAWFDDIRLTELARHTVVLSPLDGASFRDNRPTLRWRPDPYSADYQVECIGEAAQVRLTVADDHLRLPEPLPPGTYRWRVTAGGAEPSVEWTFTQTAPRDADTTGPDVTLRPTGLTDARGGVRVEARDPGGLDLETLRLQVDGEARAVTVRQEGEELVLTPREPWPRGGSRLTVALADGHGNEAEATGWLLCAPAPPKRLRWTQEQGIFDGTSAFLPLGMYQVPPEEMARVKQAGFNLVHLYTFEGSQDDERAREYLDAAQRNGLRVFLGFDRGNYSSRGLVQGNWEHVVRRLGALRDHPALLAWYLFDEPDLGHQYVSPGRLREVYELIRGLDPYHPVIVTFAMDSSVRLYPRCYDVHWTQVYGDTNYVRSRLMRHREDLPGGALAAILTCNDRKQSEAIKRGGPVDDAAFTPTLAKFRADIAMALALRSSGLSWWWYGDKRRSWLTASDVPQAWEWLTTAVAEVHEIEPLLTAEGEEMEATLACEAEDAPFAVRARKVGERVLVIVALGGEEGGEPVPFSVTVPALRGAATATVLFEDRQVEMADGVLRDTVQPVGRHYYLVAAEAD